MLRLNKKAGAKAPAVFINILGLTKHLIGVIVNIYIVERINTMNNYERITGMTVDELAEYLASLSVGCVLAGFFDKAMTKEEIKEIKLYTATCDKMKAMLLEEIKE